MLFTVSVKFLFNYILIINMLTRLSGGFQPVRLRDDEVTQLEQQLQNSYIPPIPTNKEVPKNCFLFQKRLFGE